MEFLRYATHLSNEALKVNKFLYGLNPTIKEKVCIFRPTTLHELVQQAIIAEEELLGNKCGDKTTNLSFHGKPPQRGGQYVRNKLGGSHHHGFQKNHTFNNQGNNSRQQLWQSSAHTEETPNKSVKFMKVSPTNGFWTCGGPNYERYFPKKNTESQSKQEQAIVRDMGRAHRIHAVLQNHQVKHQSTVLEASSKLNGMDVTIFIDPGAIESFISPNALLKCKLVAIYQNYFDQVEMALGRPQKVECLVKECPLDLGMCVTHVDIYVMPLGHYDMIIGMDWLESRWAVLNC